MNETSPIPTRPSIVAAVHADGIDAGVLLSELRANMFGRRERTKVGRFELIELLGRGAHGNVYLADDAQLQRRVAVKLLRAESDPGARARLLREAQALARLKHPNVLTIHDAGVDGDRIFVAMEYVEGGTLAKWCVEHPPTNRARFVALLELAIGVAEGLAAAHEAGIVHRDVKPANILVGVDGRPRIADFGLARAASGASEEAAPTASMALAATASSTQTGAIVGTPAYMPPEQLAGRSDALSDQWSLCATFWEAAYGLRPFAGDSIVALIDSVQGRPRSPPPERTEVPGWWREILARGLRADPTARWPSVAALARELERAAARRRRRIVAASGGAVIVAGLAGLGLWQLDLQRKRDACDEQAHAVDRTWNDDVRQSLHTALQGTGVSYAETTFDHAVPHLDAYAQSWREQWSALCVATEVKRERKPELWAASRQCLDERGDELSALLDVLVHRADATTVERMVDAVTRLDPVVSCADDERMARVHVAAEPAHSAEVRRELGHVLALEATGRYAEALASAQQLREQTADQPAGRLRVQVLHTVGMMSQRAGVLPDAQQWLGEAFDLAISHGEHDLAMASATALTSVVGVDLARHPEGLLWGRIAGGLAAQLGGEDDLEAAALQHGLGSVLQAQGNLADSELAHQRGLAIRERLLDADHPQLARSYNHLGTIYRVQGRFDEALTALEHSLDVDTRALGPDHPTVAHSHHNIANVLSGMGRFAEAEVEYRRALSILQKAVGEEHRLTASSRQGLAQALHGLGRTDEAEQETRRALAIREKVLGADHASVADSLDGLATILNAQGKYAEAERAYVRALELRERALGPEHYLVALSRTNLGSVYFALARYDDAAKWLQAGLPLVEQTLGATHPTVGRVWQNLAVVHRMREEYAESERAHERARIAFEATHGLDHPSTAHALEGLAIARIELGRPTQAVEDAERALAIRIRLGLPDVELASVRFVLARALWFDAAQRGRAIELAELARATGEPSPELDRWLTEHPRP